MGGGRDGWEPKWNPHSLYALPGNEGGAMMDSEYLAALDRLQHRFNEVWNQHQQMLLALENARDIIHRANCPVPASLPQKCWKECEEAMDAMLEAGWMQP